MSTIKQRRIIGGKWWSRGDVDDEARCRICRHFINKLVDDFTTFSKLIIEATKSVTLMEATRKMEFVKGYLEMKNIGRSCLCVST